MPARIRTRMPIIAFVLLTLFIAKATRTQAGRCYGADRARVVRLFEYISYVASGKLSAGQEFLYGILAQLESNTLRLTPILTMEMIRLEARWSIRQMLTSQDLSTEKMTDRLQKYVDRENQLLSLHGEAIDMTADDLRRITHMTAGALTVCRAVRQKNPDLCATLEPEDQGGLRPECESLVVSVGILYQNDCSDEAVAKLSKTWNRKTDAMRDYCLAIKEARPNRCMEIPGTSLMEQIFCRALAGQGESACGDPVFSKKTSSDCRNELLIQAVMAGKTPLNTLPRELKTQELVRPALLAALSDVTCDDLAVETYEQMIAPLDLFTRAF